MRLVEHTRGLLAARPRTIRLQDIAVNSGLPYNWLNNLSQNRLKQVDADKLQTLYEALTGDLQRLRFDNDK